MENDDLFDNFDIDDEKENKTKIKNKNNKNKNKEFLGNKRNSSSKKINDKENENLVKENPEVKNDENDTNENTEKIEDILLEKQILKILPNFQYSEEKEKKENEDLDSSQLPENIGFIIKTEKFKGGYHETIKEKPEEEKNKENTQINNNTENPKNNINTNNNIKNNNNNNFPNNNNNNKNISNNNNTQNSFFSKPLEKKPPAKVYPFQLDEFQKRAISCLEKHESVLVAAHTSAGKTVIAEYAIAMSLRDNQRVIYTSPIKALSNQKYRELKEAFNDVGLMTGDVTMNQNASCIVMTTEILRNMLFKGSEITKEMAWVIFDEVHYMRDKERGVIWEETMILLSNKINYVFLSATIPNAREFAMWICKIKKQPCNVVYTDFRPVPLQHYIYPHKGNAIYLCVDKNGNFKENNFKSAIKVLNDQLSLDNISLENKKNHNNNKKNTKYNEKNKTEDDILRIVNLIIKKNLSPAIIFSFSKKECEDHAIKLIKKDFTTDSEKEKISIIYNNAIETLSTEDKNSPQIQFLLPILLHGIGIHHGGMLPILKECVELIFQEGFIKILFSTETFSMGINMPAKTVVFTQIEKFDGEERRYLGGGEYIQMSGRAGRRGIDDIGISIVIFSSKIDYECCKKILCGKADPLNSSFHFNYNQLVNLYRLEGVESEFIVKRSFRQFQKERNEPIMKKELEEKYCFYLKEFKSDFDLDFLYNKIVEIEDNIFNLENEIRDIFIKDENLIPFLVTGRLLKLYNFQYGIVIAYKMKNIEYSEKAKKKIEKSENLKGEKKEEKFIDFNSSDDDNEDNYNNNNNENHLINVNNEDYEMTEINNSKKTLVIDVLVYISKYTDSQNNLLPGNFEEKNGKIGIIPITKDLIENISPVKVKIPENLKDKENLIITENMFFSILERFDYNIKMMDPVEEMNLDNKEDNNLIRTKMENINRLKKRKKELEIEYEKNYNSKLKKSNIEKYKNKKKYRQELKNLIQKITETEELVLQNDLTSMKRVLRRLDFISNEILTPKGQVACMISGGDELLITETLFSGKFNNLSSEELASVLTCYLNNEGGSSGIKEDDCNKYEKIENLKIFFNDLKSSANRISDILIECKVNINKEKYINQFKPEFMYFVYKWANNCTFNELIKDGSVFEGSLVRVIKRVDEFIKSLVECAEFIGNVKLKEKFLDASSKIRRGMPFAASLYLSDEK